MGKVNVSLSATLRRLLISALLATTGIASANVGNRCEKFIATPAHINEFRQRCDEAMGSFSHRAARPTDVNFIGTLSREALRGITLSYLYTIRGDLSVIPKLRTIAATLIDSLCAYEHGEVPSMYFDIAQFEDLIRIKRGSRYQKRIEIKQGYKVLDLKDGYPKIKHQRFVWMTALSYFRQSNLYTLHDSFLIDQLASLLDTVSPYVEASNGVEKLRILEVGAGTGDIARALRKRGYDITAADSFDDLFFKNLTPPRKPRSVIKSDVIAEPEYWKDYPLIVSFLGPDIVETFEALSKTDPPRFFLLFGLDFDVEDRSRFDTSDGRQLLILKINIDIADIYGGGNAVLAYTFDGDSEVENKIVQSLRQFEEHWKAKVRKPSGHTPLQKDEL